jgi:hypothetical protein
LRFRITEQKEEGRPSRSNSSKPKGFYKEPDLKGTKKKGRYMKIEVMDFIQKLEENNANEC